MSEQKDDWIGCQIYIMVLLFFVMAAFAHHELRLIRRAIEQQQQAENP